MGGRHVADRPAVARISQPIPVVRRLLLPETVDLKDVRHDLVTATPTAADVRRARPRFHHEFPAQSARSPMPQLWSPDERLAHRIWPHEGRSHSHHRACSQFQHSVARRRF